MLLRSQYISHFPNDELQGCFWPPEISIWSSRKKLVVAQPLYFFEGSSRRSTSVFPIERESLAQPSRLIGRFQNSNIIPACPRYSLLRWRCTSSKIPTEHCLVLQEEPIPYEKPCPVYEDYEIPTMCLKFPQMRKAGSNGIDFRVIMTFPGIGVDL